MNDTYINNKKYELIEFRKFRKSDLYDNEYKDGYAWSRLYEYKYVFDKLKELGNENSLIHNTSWGFAGIHILFKKKLDSFFTKTVHSDIIASDFDNTFIYDITKSPTKEHITKYDFVVNVSTVEEIDFDHIKILNNLFKQIKLGGYLIVTFDIIQNYSGIGSLNLNHIERALNEKIKSYEDNLSQFNSELINHNINNGIELNCGILVVKKINE